MRGWIAPLLVVAVLASSGCLHRAQKRERAAGYQRTLASYKDALPVGTSFLVVEQYLKERNVPFTTNRYANHLFVKIGEEPSSHWYCSYEEVSVAFEFEGPAVTLKTITLWRTGLNCL
jgi:hypothetical protein